MNDLSGQLSRVGVSVVGEKHRTEDSWNTAEQLIFVARLPKARAKKTRLIPALGVDSACAPHGNPCAFWG